MNHFIIISHINWKIIAFLKIIQCRKLLPLSSKAKILFFSYIIWITCKKLPNSIWKSSPSLKIAHETLFSGCSPFFAPLRNARRNFLCPFSLSPQSLFYLLYLLKNLENILIYIFHRTSGRWKLFRMWCYSFGWWIFFATDFPPSMFDFLFGWKLFCNFDLTALKIANNIIKKLQEVFKKTAVV